MENYKTLLYAIKKTLFKENRSVDASLVETLIQDLVGFGIWTFADIPELRLETSVEKAAFIHRVVLLLNK